MQIPVFYKSVLTQSIYLQALPLKRGESKNVKLFFTVVDDGGAPLTSPVDNQLIQAQKRVRTIYNTCII